MTNIKEDYKVRCISFMTKKKTGSGTSVNEELAQKLHEPVTEKFKTGKVYTRFKDNIWPADLAAMGSLTSFNCGIKYLLCVIDLLTKYTDMTGIKED